MTWRATHKYTLLFVFLTIFNPLTITFTTSTYASRFGAAVSATRAASPSGQLASATRQTRPEKDNAREEEENHEPCRKFVCNGFKW